MRRKRIGFDTNQAKVGPYSNVGSREVAQSIEKASDRLADALADLVFIPAELEGIALTAR
jgi:hypothetical protein